MDLRRLLARNDVFAEPGLKRHELLRSFDMSKYLFGAGSDGPVLVDAILRAEFPHSSNWEEEVIDWNLVFAFHYCDVKDYSKQHHVLRTLAAMCKCYGVEEVPLFLDSCGTNVYGMVCASLTEHKYIIPSDFAFTEMMRRIVANAHMQRFIPASCANLQSKLSLRRFVTSTVTSSRPLRSARDCQERFMGEILCNSPLVERAFIHVGGAVCTFCSKHAISHPNQSHTLGMCGLCAEFKRRSKYSLYNAFLSEAGMHMWESRGAKIETVVRERLPVIVPFLDEERYATAPELKEYACLYNCIVVLGKKPHAVYEAALLRLAHYVKTASSSSWEFCGNLVLQELQAEPETSGIPSFRTISLRKL